MKSRETLIRLKKFQVDEKRRRVLNAVRKARGSVLEGTGHHQAAHTAEGRCEHLPKNDLVLNDDRADWQSTINPTHRGLGRKRN